MQELRCHDAAPLRRRAASGAIVVDPAVAATALLGLVLAVLIAVPAPPEGEETAPRPRIESAAHSFP